MKKFSIILIGIIFSHLLFAQGSSEVSRIQTLISQNKLNEALDACSELIKLPQEKAMAYYLRSNVYSEKGFYAMAIEDATNAIEFGLNTAEIHAFRGYCNFLMHEYKLAKSDYLTACEKDSSSSLYAFNLGNVNQQMYKWREASDAYTKAIKLYPQYADAYKNRGYISMTKGKFVEAIRDYDSALKYHQNDEIVILYRGMALTSLKRYNEAINMFNRCIRLKEKNGAAYYNRGLVKFQQRDFMGAKLDYDTAIQYKPDMEIAYFNRALAKLELSNKHYEISCDDFRKAAELGYMESLIYLKKYCD